MTRKKPRKIAPLLTGAAVLWSAFASTACGEAFDNGCRDTLDCSIGGAAGRGAGGTKTGGATSGGTSTGGRSSGGTSTGGTSTGGKEGGPGGSSGVSGSAGAEGGIDSGGGGNGGEPTEGGASGTGGGESTEGGASGADGAGGTGGDQGGCNASIHACTCRIPSTTNILLNPGFDATSSGWEMYQGASWTPEDAEQCAASGSIKVEVAPNLHLGTVFQCRPTAPGVTYFFGYKYKLAANSEMVCYVHAFTTADCTGDIANTVAVQTAQISVPVDWTSSTPKAITTPAGARSVQAYCQLNSPGTGYVDQLYLNSAAANF